MQKSKKHILGAIGLASVAGMTMLAHGIPAPAAYAETTSDVNFKVVVPSENVSIKIIGDLQDGGATSKDSVTVPIQVGDTATLRYSITASQSGKTPVLIGDVEVVFDDQGNATVTVLDNAVRAQATQEWDGIYNVNLPLKEYADDLVANHGYDENAVFYFTLKAKATNATGISAEDAIIFQYSKVTIDPNKNIDDDAKDDETNTKKTDPQNGDPIIDVETNDEVEKIHVVVKDPNTGETVWEGDFPADTDTTEITLPFAENGIPSGNYDIEIYAYDKNGNLVGKTDLNIRYVRPDGVGLPNTGGSIFAGLNIGEADFLVSGALVFFFIGAAGIYLIRRSTKSRR